MSKWCFCRLNKSRAQRILWLFEELDVPYELKTYERGPDGLAGPELKQVHPLGKSPAVTVQSADGNSSRTIVESGPIVEYITEYFGKHLIPQRWEPGKENKIAGETEDWLRYRHFMFVIALLRWTLQVARIICLRSLPGIMRKAHS